MTLKEFRFWVVTVLMDFAFYICPMCKFKISYAFFLRNNIKKLK